MRPLWIMQPMVGRSDEFKIQNEKLEDGQTHFFLGGDPAPAQTKKADDGALGVLRVRPKPGLGRPPTGNVSDWEAAFVWAYRVRGETRRQEDQGVYLAETSRQWSGLIHARHRAFNFSGVCLDPQGGGSFVMTELNKTRQVIDGIETDVTPIATADDLTAGMASYILTMFRRKDSGVSGLWPILQGDDNLYDALHMTFQQAVEHGMVLFPKPYNDRDPAEHAEWSQEKKWALKNLDAARFQMCNIQAATREDGSWQLTSRGAKSYQAAGKKDLAYACLYAYVRFLIWLRQNELEFSNPEDGEGGTFYVA